MAESDLYKPIKAFLEKQGYTVKGEVGPCDVVGVREGESPVVVELKERLTLALVLQAVDRLRVAEHVYVAFRTGKGQSGTWRKSRKHVLALARRLGLGVLTVSSRNQVNPVLDPGPYQPRPDKRRRQRLLKEFAERVGDPEVGGTSTRKRFTVYRQDAVRCAQAIAAAETASLQLKEIRACTGVARATSILYNNHYGWFERVARGQYTLTPKGLREYADWVHRLEGAD